VAHCLYEVLASDVVSIYGGYLPSDNGAKGNPLDDTFSPQQWYLLLIIVEHELYKVHVERRELVKV